MFYSITNKYKFTKEKNGYLLNRNDDENKHYIAEVVSLSFHKALFGISELRALNYFATRKNAGGFRMSKAINTYYIGYHLMTFCLLIDENYDIILKKKLVNGKVPLEINSELLNSDEETPDRWNKQKDLETDLASMISHADLKNYCKKFREGKFKINDINILFYNNFIANNCNLIWYEKLCYIRDRVVYRPTVVIDDNDGGLIQTSADVREEIDNLPSWKQLYDFITKLHNKIISIFKMKPGNMNALLLAYLWGGIPMEEDYDYIKSLGWKDDDIEKYKCWQAHYFDTLSFDSYICHMVEIFNIERIRKDFKSFWYPLKKKYERSFEKNLRGNGWRSKEKDQPLHIV